MASAKQLREGMVVTIDRGVWEGTVARVLNPNVAPPGHPHQRCVLLDIPGAGETWVLPRLLLIGDYTQPAASIDAPVQQAALVSELGLVDTRINDPMDPSLDRFRPDPLVVHQYQSRMLASGLQDFDHLLLQRDQQRTNGYAPNIALVGETQSGKTMLVQVLAVLAAERDGHPKPYPVFTLNGSIGITNYDLFGQTTAVEVNGQERLVWLEGIVPMALRCGGILYLDEWNAVNQGQATALHPVLDDRRQFINTHRVMPNGHGGWMPEVVKAHPNTWIIATVNPAGYRGVTSMPEASTNRFRWISWDYDSNIEAKLVPSSTVRALGEALREARAERTLSTPVGTSTLVRFSEDAALFGAEYAISSLVSMFDKTEQAKVRYIIEDSNFADLLMVEYPNPNVPVADPDVQPDAADEEYTAF